MGLQLRDGRFVSRIFFGELLNPYRGNIMAFLYRDSGTTEWVLYFRLRFYEDAILDRTSKDFRKAFSMKSSDELEPFMKRCKDFLRMAVTFNGGTVIEEIVVDSDRVEDVSRILGEQSWAHNEPGPPQPQATP